MINNLDDLAVELGLMERQDSYALVPTPPRPNLQAEADRADDAYTQAIQDAARTNNWYAVPAAAHAAKQARSALTAAKGQALCHERHTLAPGIHQNIPHTHEGDQ